MFTKKKQSLPARPSIPSREEILQDLRESGDDDVVFKPWPKIEKERESLSNDEISSETIITDNLTSDTATTYEMAKLFLDKCNYLESALLDIEEKKTSLSETQLALNDDIKNVKEALGEKRRSKTPVLIG